MEVENREEYSIVDECKKTLCTRYIKHLYSGVGEFWHYIKICLLCGIFRLKNITVGANFRQSVGLHETNNLLRMA